MKLHLSKNLEVPLNFVTEKLAFIGVTGSGKSYGAQKSAEQLWRARAPFVVVDPKGDWWGLRLDEEGNGPGLPIPIFGGLKGDVPLEPTGGALIADLIFDKHISAVVDVSQFDTDADRTRFLTGFLDRLFQRHKRAPTARHLYLDEAQEIIPQNPQRGEERLVHVAQRVQKMGRGVGLGTSLITPRPQDVSKKALNQAQTIFMFRLMGSQERKAIKDWVTDKGVDEALLDGLPGLASGTAHVWSPAWLKTFATISIARRDTFDSSATPEVGAKAVVHDLAAVDVGALKEAMAATIERAKADDPAALRARIRELEGKQDHGGKANHQAWERIRQLEATLRDHKCKTVEVPALSKADLHLIEASTKQFDAALEKLEKVAKEAMERGLEAAKVVHEAKRVAVRVLTKPEPALSDSHPELAAAIARHTGGINIPPQTHKLIGKHPVHTDVEARAGVNGPQKAILGALAFLESIGVAAAERRQIALYVGVSAKASGFENNLGYLRAGGLVVYPPPGGLVALTDSGRVNAPKEGIPTTTAELHEVILSRISGPQKSILEAVIRLYPDSVTREKLADYLGVSPRASGFENNLGALKTMGAISYPAPGMVRAEDRIFIRERVAA